MKTVPLWTRFSDKKVTYLSRWSYFDIQVEILQHGSHLLRIITLLLGLLSLRLVTQSGQFVDGPWRVTQGIFIWTLPCIAWIHVTTQMHIDGVVYVGYTLSITDLFLLALHQLYLHIGGLLVFDIMQVLFIVLIILCQSTLSEALLPQRLCSLLVLAYGSVRWIRI